MPGFELEKLLEPVSEASPVGENLEYDPRFSELERASAGQEERYSGKEVIAAKEPEWKEVRAIATELLGRTKDLRVAVRLATAEAALDGISGLASGVALIRGLLERYWDGIHPALEPDDSNDPVFRVNALASLADPAGLYGIVRKSYLVESRSVGRFTFRDLDVAEQRTSPVGDETAPGPELLLSALTEAGGDYAQARLSMLNTVRDDLRSIDKVFSDKTGGQAGPNFEVLDKTLGYGVAFLAKGVPKGQDDTGEGGIEQADGSVSGDRTVAVGALRSREDVKRVLEQVCIFMERTEPSNPAPILIRRAQRLLDVGFMDIIQDLAPDAVAQIEKLVGSGRPG
ncbi:MAG TPA: type VI secretion system protein TssA [Burkholderiales bacterium]|nr:type VI secretion system protein TssA [Burkholderiales bacterium]